jgi:hypothetical protein
MRVASRRFTFFPVSDLRVGHRKPPRQAPRQLIPMPSSRTTASALDGTVMDANRVENRHHRPHRHLRRVRPGSPRMLITIRTGI